MTITAPDTRPTPTTPDGAPAVDWAGTIPMRSRPRDLFAPFGVLAAILLTAAVAFALGGPVVMVAVTLPAAIVLCLVDRRVLRTPAWGDHTTTLLNLDRQ